MSVRVQKSMFEFAISQNRKHPPTRRFLVTSAASCFIHVVFILLLIEYPQLLGPGLNMWLERPVSLARELLHISGRQQQQPNWRTVTFVGKSSKGRMAAPSLATLRKYMYDWSKQGKEAAAPPVRVRWGNEQQASLGEDRARVQTRPVLGTKDPQPAPQGGSEQAAAGTGAGATGDAAAGGAAPGQVAGGEAGAKGTVYLPAPQTASVRKPAETNPDAAPGKIPAGIPQPAPPVTASVAPKTPPPQTKAPAKIFEDEQKAKLSQESGLFDTKGFPLGEYANLIIERVRGNWMIPSNLRNSQGRTTLIFYIDKEGRFANLHIVVPSGSSSLDLTALNAVIESNPFPPLPKGFPGDRVGAKFVFSYNERQ